MSARNVAVVFAPTLMRDHNVERDLTDSNAKNDAITFMIENSQEIFGGA